MAVVEAIATTYLESSVASVTFSSIPATYEHLQVRASVMSDTVASGVDYYYVRFNGDTGGNYSNHRMFGRSNTVVAAEANAGQTYNWSPYMPTYGLGTDYSSINFGYWVIDVHDYANTNKNTTIMWNSGVAIGTTAVTCGSGLWDDTSAVDEITLLINIGTSSNLARGSVFTLYGLNSS